MKKEKNFSLNQVYGNIQELYLFVNLFRVAYRMI